MNHCVINRSFVDCDNRLSNGFMNETLYVEASIKGG